MRASKRSGSGEALGGPRPWKNVVLGLEIAIFSRKTSIFGPWESLGQHGLPRDRALGGPRPWENVVLGLEIAIF